MAGRPIRSPDSGQGPGFSAIFSVINAVLWRPLPYEEADRLMIFTEWSEEVPEMSFSVANVALLACYLPARRATRVDPMVALRYE